MRKLHTDRCGNIRGRKCRAKWVGKEVKLQEFVFRHTTNVEQEMCDCTSYNWNHRNSVDSLQETALLGIPQIIRTVIRTNKSR
jgi:hypothetical protein